MNCTIIFYIFTKLPISIFFFIFCSSTEYYKICFLKILLMFLFNFLYFFICYYFTEFRKDVVFTTILDDTGKICFCFSLVYSSFIAFLKATFDSACFILFSNSSNLFSINFNRSFSWSSFLFCLRNLLMSLISLFSFSF